MPSAMLLPMSQSVPQIGNALVNLVNANNFNLRTFPHKFKWNPVPGKPSIRAKYDGIADDSRVGTPDVRSPGQLRYEVQIIHPEFAPNQPDGLEFAQVQVVNGTSEFYEKIQDDPSLGGLLLHTEVVGSVTGPLTVNSIDVHGEEIIIVVTLY